MDNESNNSAGSKGFGKGKQDHGRSNLVVVSEILPDKIIIAPIQPRPIFPHIMVPLTFTGQELVEAIRTAYEKHDRFFGVVLVKNENREDYMKSQLYDVGVIMKIFKINQISEDTIQVVAQGLQRFRKVRAISREPFLKWEVKAHYESREKHDEEQKSYTMAIMSSVKELFKMNPIMQEQLKMILNQMTYDKPHMLIDSVASVLSADAEKLQDLLETFDLSKRSEKLLLLLKEEIQLTEVQEKIRKQIEEKVSKQQKEYFLREQLKAIKKELGLEKDDKSAELEKIENKLKKLKLTEEASKAIREEMEKLKMLEPVSPEFHVTRNYLHILTELPWGVYTKDSRDIAKARKILNEQHYGLEDVKKLILEFIGTIIKRQSVAGSIICLVGPPGVGKTSIGRSIADALNRKFFRFSLGGIRDEAEIKGHRRTYIGAMPGKIMQSLKQAGTSNPVIMLDEIDKIGMSYQGDPASALLEVLDPEQNNAFLDHYTDVRFDLSKILFVTTANQLDTIPRPLLDRMEVIKLSGYILEEKVEIARQYLIPRQMENHNLKKSDIRISNPALRTIIDSYAREAGVRNLENQIKKIMRQITLKEAEGEKGPFSVTKRNLEKYLGKPVFTTEQLYRRNVPGVSLGLAWTSMGGTTMYVEASAVNARSAGFRQTGQLGKVMEESSEIAYSYVRSLLTGDERYRDFFLKNFIHLHVPAGATPKDGPSAGITMATALYSLATNRPVKEKLGMTGELTLTGKVLPVGGIKEKTIAARRVGVNDLILPLENKKDFEELPGYIRDGITPYFADYLDDVLKIALKERTG